MRGPWPTRYDITAVHIRSSRVQCVGLYLCPSPGGLSASLGSIVARHTTDVGITRRDSREHRSLHEGRLPVGGRCRQTNGTAPRGRYTDDPRFVCREPPNSNRSSHHAPLWAIMMPGPGFIMSQSQAVAKHIACGMNRYDRSRSDSGQACPSTSPRVSCPRVSCPRVSCP